MTTWRLRFRRKPLAPVEVAELTITAEPDHAWKALGLVNDWIKHAETKAGATLAATGVIGGVLYNLVKDVHSPGWYFNTLASLCGISVFVTGILAALALWPRLRSREDPTSALYFNHIARAHSSPATYQETLRLLTSNSDELIKEIAGQVWANAGVAHRKYHWSSRALAALIVSLVLLGAVTVVIALGSI